MKKMLVISLLVLSIFLGGCAAKKPKFTVDWPGKPVYQKKGFAHIYLVDKKDVAYVVIAVEYKKEKVKKLGQKKILEDQLKTLKRQYSVNKVSDYKEIKLGQNPGFECQVKTNQIDMKSRIYMIGNMSYSIGVAASHRSKLPKDTDKFLKSFKVQ